jgi:dienelactone hydrolase
MTHDIDVTTERYFSDYYADVLVPSVSDPAPVVLLWHGITPNERQVMRKLGMELADGGAVVVVADWSSTAIDEGRAALLASVQWTQERLRGAAVDWDRACLIGWSRGARAALGYALDHPRNPFGRVIGLAGQYAIPIATASRPPLELASTQTDVDVVLIHGTADRMLPAQGSHIMYETMTSAGTNSRLVLVDTDHAGVVLTRWDEDLKICLPERVLTPGEQDVLEVVCEFVFDLVR